MPRVKKVEAVALIGPAVFYIGLLIALGTAFLNPTGWLYVGLGALGVIIGLLNITIRESGPFLLASIAFIVIAVGVANLVTAAGLTVTPAMVIPNVLVRLAANLTVLVGGAAMVVALRAIYEAARGR